MLSRITHPSFTNVGRTQRQLLLSNVIVSLLFDLEVSDTHMRAHTHVRILGAAELLRITHLNHINGDTFSSRVSHILYERLSRHSMAYSWIMEIGAQHHNREEEHIHCVCGQSKGVISSTIMNE